MARISIWYVRASLPHFLAGVSVGAWQLAASADLVPGGGTALRSVHVDVLLVGWLVQFALGVAAWILPSSRGVSADRRLWGAWVALNGGVLMVAVAAGTQRALLEVAGRTVELGVVGAVLLALWPRARSFPVRSSERV